jgi:DNA-binding NarL/FixJ family response regulator
MSTPASILRLTRNEAQRPARSALRFGRNGREGEHAPKGGTMDLLVVEGEALLRQTLVESLQEAGLVVSGAASADAALEVAAASGPPAVLVTDSGNGSGRGCGLDGIELAAVVSRRWPQVGILHMEADPEHLADRRLGAHERSIAKPFSATTLVRAVRDLMAGREFVSGPWAGDAAGRAHATGPAVPPIPMRSALARVEAARELA